MVQDTVLQTYGESLVCPSVGGNSVEVGREGRGDCCRGTTGGGGYWGLLVVTGGLLEVTRGIPRATRGHHWGIQGVMRGMLRIYWEQKEEGGDDLE